MRWIGMMDVESNVCKKTAAFVILELLEGCE
jgi:hypothetical protein